MNLSVMCVAVGTLAVSLGAAAQTNTNTNPSTNTLPTVPERLKRNLRQTRERA
jgi:hypothetical protein